MSDIVQCKEGMGAGGHCYTCAAALEHRQVRHRVVLDDKRAVELFVNRDTRLVVLDVTDADEKGGTEVYRRNV